MRKLLDRLEEFKYYQLAKFIKARQKQRPTDALNDATNWSKWPLDVIENHLFAEVEEYKTSKTGDVEETKKELADIANVAFLLWAMLEYDD
jgi:NTP pyrophosphatase (non-canonical NTP hydrolase)